MRVIPNELSCFSGLRRNRRFLVKGFACEELTRVSDKAPCVLSFDAIDKDFFCDTRKRVVEKVPR